MLAQCVRIHCRNRGTECIRSPEMLLASSSRDSSSAQQGSASLAACDVWALGCLLHELVTGSVLFPTDMDWSKFFITVTDPNQVCVEPPQHH